MKGGIVQTDFEALLELRINGNISDFRARVCKMRKADIGDFLLYIMTNYFNGTRMQYIEYLAVAMKG